MDDRTSLPGIKPAGRVTSRLNRARRDWVIAKALNGPDWNAVDDALRSLPGAVSAPHETSMNWVAVPPTSFGVLRTVMDQHPRRIQVRSL